MSSIKRIFIIGHSGAGKGVLAQAVAKSLGWKFINADVLGCAAHKFTSSLWVEELQKEGVKISMTGKGRCHDNIFIERFWRSFKQEAFYLNDYVSVAELKKAIEKYVEFYNDERWHQSLNYQVPATLYKAMKTVTELPKAA